MSYPKFKYSKKESVIVMDEKQEKDLGKAFFDSPVEAKSEFEYEGKDEKKDKSMDGATE